jgi:hypothetical protein
MHARRLSWALAFLALGGGLLLWLATRPGPAAQAPAPPGLVAGPAADLVGTATCSARGCHGAPTPRATARADEPVRHDEYTRRLAQDPHAAAYEALLNEHSRMIADALHIERPHEERLCVACHTNPSATGPQAEERRFGVGCESCHGAARQWFEPHTTAGAR